MKTYERLDEIPSGRASEKITEGCAVLEGGAWRGIYTLGVIDRLMENDINMQCTVGVSAGALCGMNYVAGQIGRAARINLSHRHDRNYMGIGAIRRDHGITGFSYLFNELNEEYPFDEERFFDPKRRYVAVAANIETGKPEYFEKDDREHIFRAIQASASVPYVSEPVQVGEGRYLDGGLGVKIPVDWAVDEGYRKIVVIRTRDRQYRKKIHAPRRITNIEYRKYPNLIIDLEQEAARYNVLVDHINMLENTGRVFVIAPSKPISVHRFEGDMNALGDIYWLGYQDALERLDDLKAYLAEE